MNANEALQRLEVLHYLGLTPAEAVEEAVTIYLELGAQIEALDAARAAAKTVIGDVIAETGQDRFSTHAGLAYVANPSLRIAYDAKGIDAVVAERPDLAALLAPYRRETMVAGTLTIRAAGGKGA